MIVPRNPLIGLVAGICLPAALAAASRPGLTVPVLLAVLVLAGAAAMDAWKSGRGIKGLHVDVPAIIRMTVERPSRIAVTIGKPDAMAAVLRVGLPLTKWFVSDQKDINVDLAPGIAAVELHWPCRPLRRGKYTIERCHLEIASRWRLWAVRRTISVSGEIRVYPDLVSGQQKLLGLFRRRELGLRVVRRVGKGREFEQLRDYLPGDSFEDIDWKATARRRHLISRVFQVEQAQEIYLLLDASRLSTRSADYVIDRRSRRRDEMPARKKTIFEQYITAALVMAVVAEQATDRFGLLVFSDKPDCFIKAGRGSANYNACRDALYHRMPRSVSPDFDELFAYIGARLRKRVLLVFLTSLDDPVLADGFIRAMRSAARRHVMLVNMFRPPGAHPLFSSHDIFGRQGIYQHLMGHMLWDSVRETGKRMRMQGVGLHLLDKEQLCSQLVTQYMEVKQRQLI
jgi:uncharacterized protein (DUF58 family)